jgi:hypothetical protein
MMLDPITELVATMAARRRMRLAFIRGKSRDPSVVRVRIEIAKKLRSKDIKLEEIAYHLNRHHTTVVYYLTQRPARLARYAAKQEARHEENERRGLRGCDPAGDPSADRRRPEAG